MMTKEKKIKNGKIKYICTQFFFLLRKKGKFLQKKGK